MKTIQYTKLFSPISETFIYDHVVGLRKLGLDVHVATHGRKNRDQRPFPEVSRVQLPERWNPRRIWHRGLGLIQGDDPQVANWPIWRDQLEEIACRIDADLIHAHFGPQGVKAAPVARRLGIPLVVTFYGYDVSQLPRDDFWSEKYDEIWTAAERVHVLSEEMKQRVVDLGADERRVRVVHLSRDLDEYEYHPPERRVRRFLSVGRLVEKKGHADAIRGVKQGVDQGMDIMLDILGGGRLYEELQELVRSLNLEDRVTLHGQVESDEVLRQMKQADAFILCSKTPASGDKEGTPTVFIEAQSIGLPCVATRHAGIPEMIPESSHHFLAPEGGVDAIADCISRMASCSVEELQALARRGRKKMEAEFNKDKELRKTADIYRAVVE